MKKRILSILLVLCMAVTLLPAAALATEFTGYITGLSITVDGVSYTEGNVTARPDSTVFFTVTGENLNNVDQKQIIDTPKAYLPLYSIPLQEDGTYLYTTYASVFESGNNYQITYTNDAEGNAISPVYNISVEAYVQNHLSGSYNDVVIAMMKYSDAVAAID